MTKIMFFFHKNSEKLLSLSFSVVNSTLFNFYRLIYTNLTSWGTTEKEGHLSVGNSLFWQIVVEDDSVAVVITEPLSHGASRVGSQVLKRGGIGGGSNNDNRVFHGASSLETGYELRNGWLFLSNGNVDAVPEGIS